MTTLRPFAPPCRPETGGAARRVLCAVLAAALAWTPTAATLAQQNDALRLPALGESASDEFNLSAEKRLGEQIMREIRRDPDYLDDPQLLDYLQSVWQPLVQAAKARGDIGPDTEHLFPYEPFLVRDRSVNAFALPGGYVGVHLALIAMTATRDELASVLAHELSHITQRHIARSIVAANRSSTLGLAAILIGIFAAARASNADMANAALATGQHFMPPRGLPRAPQQQVSNGSPNRSGPSHASYQRVGLSQRIHLACIDEPPVSPPDDSHFA